MDKKSGFRAVEMSTTGIDKKVVNGSIVNNDWFLSHVGKLEKWKRKIFVKCLWTTMVKQAK